MPPPSHRRFAVLRILHPFPSLLVTAVTVGLIPLANADAEVALYVQLGVGMLCFQFAIGVVNDIADEELDVGTKPWKPLAAGLISRRQAVLLGAALAGAGLLVTISIDALAWAIGAAGLGCGLVYDLWLKRTPWSWVPWSIAMPLIPVWVFVATDSWDAMLWWAFPLGGALGLSLYLANQAPGAARERAAGVSGAAQRAGEWRSRAMAIALFGATASAAVLILLTRSAGAAALAAAAALVACLLAPRAQRFFGPDGLFGLLAASSGLLALIFLAAV